MLLRPSLQKALLSYGTRLNSSTAGPSKNWMDVALPPRPDKLNIPNNKKKGLSPNLSYLNKASESSLAGRLAKRPVSETVRQFDKTIRTAENNADRLNHLGPLLESPGPLPLAQSAKPNVNRDPLLDSDRPLPLARSAKPKVEIPDDMLSPSALKRREERRRRESEVLRLRERSLSRNRQPTENISLSDIMEIDEEEDISEIDPAELEHLSPMAEAPEFDGPEESISETLDDSLSGTVRYHPSGKGHDLVDVSKSPSYRLNPDVICSLVGGDYSQYTSLSSTMRKATSPNALTVVNTAELALSSQPDYIVPQRKEAIEIVKHLVDRSSYKAKLSDDTEPALFRGELEK